MKPEYQNEADRTAALIGIWREVLNREDLDENSDLFEVGGTSMHVLQIVGQVYDVFEADLRLRQVFEHASPKSLSAFLSEA